MDLEKFIPKLIFWCSRVKVAEVSELAILLMVMTWTVWVSATCGIGIGVVRLVGRGSKIGLRAQSLMAIWSGAFCLVFLTVFLNFVVPMSGTVGYVVSIVWVGSGTLLLVKQVIRMRGSFFGILLRASRQANFFTIVSVGLACLSAFASAWFAVAEPMDYDAGLYRMGLINYAADFPVIPGLANLHDRFGFGSALGPMSALLSNGVWEESNFRVISGFFIMLLLLDMVVRIAVPRRRTAGDFLIVLGWGFVAWMILSDSGRWVPSPGQDLIALITGVAALALFLDYVDPMSRSPWQASTALLAAGVSAAIRPLAGVLVLSVVVGVLAAGRVAPAAQARSVSLKAGAGALTAVLVLGLVMAARDVMISGWVLFPLSLFPANVDWLASDPRSTSLGITWWGRAPGVPIDAAEVSGWFGPWVNGFLVSREMQFVRVLVVFVLITFLWKAGRTAWRHVWRPVLLVTLAIAAPLGIWFVTAPDPRFGWTPLFAVMAAPLALLLAHGAYPRYVYRAVFLMVLALGCFLEWRAQRFEQRGNEFQPQILYVLGQQVQVMLGPPNQVVTIPGLLGDGTPVVFPRNGENCYTEFPLCLLPGTGSNVESRGTSIADGFRIRR